MSAKSRLKVKRDHVRAGYHSLNYLRLPTTMRQLLLLLTFLCGTLVMSGRLGAQASRTTTLDFGTGSQFEDYLRVLQVAGMEPLQPWSIRGFSPRVITRMAAADTAGP